MCANLLASPRCSPRQVMDVVTLHIVDPMLPAVTYLVGAEAHHALGAAVSAAGGTLLSTRALQVQYEPEHELVVHYRCEVDWGDGHPQRETLLAATSVDGVIPGTIPVLAETADGDLAVSVWRYPFDPVATGMPSAVTPCLLEPFTSPMLKPPIDLTVVAYRPTQRAVVRASDATGQAVYVKVVPPDAVEVLVEKHRGLRATGLPVPVVLGADDELGLVVLAELTGTTLRERIKSGLDGWPEPQEVLFLREQLAAIPTAGLAVVPSRVRDAVSHARLIERVVPDLIPGSSRLIELFEQTLPDVESRSNQVIHGDLHEGQVIVDEGGIIRGVLDIDELGCGDPLGDLATLIAHIRFRGLVAETGGDRILEYSDRLRDGFSDAVDGPALDIVIAAVLVGLATGPFRIQQPGWTETTRLVIEEAQRVVYEAMR